MITLAGHGKDDRLIQAELPLAPNAGDRIEINSRDGFKGEGIFVGLSPMVSWWGVEVKDKKNKLVKYFDPNDCKIAKLPQFQIGDRVRDCDGFEGVITSLRNDHLTIENETNRHCYNLPLCKKPLHKLISHISTASAESEPLAKLADAQEKSTPSRTSTSTKRRNKSIATTSQNLASIPTSETITHPKESISIQEVFPVQELPTLEANKGSITQSPPCGLNTSESSMKDNPNLLSLKTQHQLSLTDYEQYLEDCEWLDIVGTIHKSYKLLSLEAPKKEKGCLSLPTLTTGLGSGRNAGQTRLEKALKDKGFRLDTQALSIEGMCLLFGFPPNWAKSLCSVPKVYRDGMKQESCLDAPSTLTAPSQLSNESSISIAVSGNNIDARLQFLLEQRDRLIASGASPQGVWLSCGQVYKKDFRQVVWKSAHEHEWLGGNKSRYIGKENSDEHKSAIAQHKAGQELRKIEREIKKLQVKS